MTLLPFLSSRYDIRNALEGHMRVARETPTFIYGDSLDMTGFQDGAGNPEEARDEEVAAVPEGSPGAGGCHIIAQRWIHDLKGFHGLALGEQEGVFGRTTVSQGAGGGRGGHSWPARRRAGRA